jgi:hypothetical protein
MNPLRAVNRLRRPARWGVKVAFLLLVLLAITYPKPWLLVRELRRSADVGALVAPDEPALQPWREELEGFLATRPGLPHKQVLKFLEIFVRAKVPYDWDWNTWGVANYTPAVAEVVRMGREDCDGRAIVAASLARGLGYDARLVGNLSHMWVWTPYGELMTPSGAKTFEPTATGYRFNWASLLEWPSHVSFGLAVFPLGRELIMVAAIWLCGVSLAARRWTWFASLVLLVLGLVVIRLSARDPGQVIHRDLWLGWCHVAAGVLLLWFGPRIRGRAAGPKPE